MQNSVKTKKDLEAMLSSGTLSDEERVRIQTMLDEEDYVAEGATVTYKKIRESLEKHRETLDYLAKN